MFYFDPLYFVLLIPGMLFAGWAQLKVKSSFAKGSQIAPASGLSGVRAARGILDAYGLSNVDIERIQGRLGDHYDPKKKVLRLSPDVYDGVSLAALGVAAHEAGHAIQDAEKYGPLVLRNNIVPLASFGSNASWFIIMAGMMFGSFNLVIGGILLFSAVVVFQLVNLPVEYDASARAKSILVERAMISPQEQKTVSSVLDAAALTYVAATVSAILTLIYFLIRSGILGGRRD